MKVLEYKVRYAINYKSIFAPYKFVNYKCHTHTHTHRHTHNRFTALLDSVRDYLGEPAPEGKTNLDLLEQEIVSGSGISWTICKSTPWPRHITMPAFHHSVFYRPGALPATKPTASKHWRQNQNVPVNAKIIQHKNIKKLNPGLITSRMSGLEKKLYVPFLIIPGQASGKHRSEQKISNRQEKQEQ